MLLKKKLKEFNRKPNKIGVNKGSEFYNRSMKSWLEKNDIEMYSSHHEEKSGISERFITTLKKYINKRLQFQEMFILIN